MSPGTDEYVAKRKELGEEMFQEFLEDKYWPDQKQKNLKKKNKMECVYLIRAEKTNLYKIGVTKTNVKHRLKASQTGNPYKLTIKEIYPTDISFKIETVLRRRLVEKKYISEDFDNLMGEWYEFNQKDVENFKDQCQKIEDQLKFLDKNSTYFKLDGQIQRI